MNHLGASKNRGGCKTLQIIHFNKVFHDFHHPFWDTTIFGNTHLLDLKHPTVSRKNVHFDQKNWGMPFHTVSLQMATWMCTFHMKKVTKKPFPRSIVDIARGHDVFIIHVLSQGSSELLEEEPSGL